MTDAGEPMTIDVVSDVVCPWCYLVPYHLVFDILREDSGQARAGIMN